MILLGVKLQIAFTIMTAKVVNFIDINAECDYKLCVLRVLKEVFLGVLKVEMLDIEILSRPSLSPFRLTCRSDMELHVTMRRMT